MLRHNRFIKVAILTLGVIISITGAKSQGSVDNGTRAVFIFDIAKYIDYGPGFADSAVFKIGVLDNTIDLFQEMGNVARTRTTIQGKPVQLVKFYNEDRINHTQVLYLNKASGYNLNKVKAMLNGRQTLLLTEGYEFRESMINFMGVEGQMPKYGVNEDMIKKAGMNVNSNMLTQAIKTKEDWENLFGKASEQIEIQRDTIKRQLEMINSQKAEILKQKAHLDSLNE